MKKISIYFLGKKLPPEDVKPYIDALNLKISSDQIEQLYVLLNKITQVH